MADRRQNLGYNSIKAKKETTDSAQINKYTTVFPKVAQIKENKVK